MQRSLLIAGLVALGLEVAIVCGGGGLLLCRLAWRALPAPNARCPCCGERFYVRYHRGDIARFTQWHECPNCGCESPEGLLTPGRGMPPPPEEQLNHMLAPEETREPKVKPPKGLFLPE
jgi:hypothetical protein